MKNYLFNYLDSIPDSTLRELTENTTYINNQKGNYTNNYLYNYDNSIPDITLREIISNIIKIANFNGNIIINLI
jgi:predicted nuclease of restriction endonuclease-like (RecB) superfamily